MPKSRRTLIIEQSPGGLTNFASSATVTASSSGSYNGVQTQPSGAVDGTNTPWVSASGGAGQWVYLTFPTRINMNLVYLYDRGNPNDQIASGSLRFDDGSIISFGPVNNDGSATSISFPSLQSSSILFTVTAVSQTTTDVGLTELQVFYNQSVSSPSATSVFTSSETSGATDTAGLGIINTTPFGSAQPTPNAATTFTSVVTKNGATYTVTSTGAAAPTGGSSGKSTLTHSIGAIAGGAAGGVVLILLACIFFCVFCRGKARRKARLEIDELETSAAEIKRPAQSRPPVGAAGPSYHPFDHHTLATGQTGFTRFSPSSSGGFPSQPSTPGTYQDSRPNSSTPFGRDHLQVPGSPPLVPLPSSHQKPYASTSSFGADSASGSRPFSSASQGSYGSSGPSSGDVKTRPQAISEVWEGGDPESNRPWSGPNQPQVPTVASGGQHAHQQTYWQSTTNPNHPSAPSTSLEWNPYHDNSIRRPLSPGDAPPRYDALGL